MMMPGEDTNSKIDVIFATFEFERLDQWCSQGKPPLPHTNITLIAVSGVREHCTISYFVS